MSGSGRRWLELSARSPSAGDRGALLADALVALGGRAIEERGGWFVTYLEEPDDLDAFMTRATDLVASSSGLTDVQLSIDWQAHEDWAETWKRGLAPRRVTDRLVVRPSWTPLADSRPGDIEIVIDPGMAFGTAEHGTTRGCLRLLDGLLAPGDSVLDIGAGSGILAVAAAKLGASTVHAFEGDALACEALRENLAENHVDGLVTVVERWIEPDTLGGHPQVAGVLANLEAGIVRPLLPSIVGCLVPRGWLIVSGILADEWGEIRESTLELGTEFLSIDADGDWRSGAFRRLS